MEWNMKMPPWMLAELNQETEQRIFSLIGSSSASQQQASRAGCSVDLKLEGIGNFGSSKQWKDQKMRASTATVTSSGASRRARAQSSGGQIASCSVDGCAVDLSKCREYHRRHKVCELHSKTPIVVVGGQEQRFCQQCSRFHSLSEFDEGKRSCRKRLDGHNKRRRKPQLDSLNPGSLLTNYQGTRFSQHPQIRAAAMPDPNWANLSLKSEHATVCTHLLPLQFTFVQESAAALNSERALSLLSSTAQSSHINMNPMMSAADKIPIAQPLQHCDGTEPYPFFQSSSCVSTASCAPMEDGNAGSNLVSDANYTNLHSQILFQAGSKELIEGISGAHAIRWQW